MFGLLSKIGEIVRLVKVFAAVLAVVGLGIAGFMYSPFFKTFFLGIAVGAGLLFGLEMSNILPATTVAPKYCINPRVDPNGPHKMCWTTTDDARGYGYWSVCQ